MVFTVRFVANSVLEIKEDTTHAKIRDSADEGPLPPPAANISFAAESLTTRDSAAEMTVVVTSRPTLRSLPRFQPKMHSLFQL